MTPKRDIRLFLADVDGALVTTHKVLTEAAKSAVRDLDQAGIAFAVTSGRPPRGMSMLIEPLALRTPIRDQRAQKVKPCRQNWIACRPGTRRYRVGQPNFSTHIAPLAAQ